MSDEPLPENIQRREQLVRRACRIMGWEYKQGLIWMGLRKAALSEAVVISLDKLDAMLDRLDLIADLTDSLQHLHDAQPFLLPPYATRLREALLETSKALARAESLLESQEQ